MWKKKLGILFFATCFVQMIAFPNGVSAVECHSSDIIDATWGHMTVAVREDGTVLAAGDNTYGQIDAVSGWTGIKAVSAGHDFIVGLNTDGTVVGAGNNIEGQLEVSSWSGIKAISAGWNRTVGLKEDGTVVGAGNNGSDPCRQ